MPDIHVIENIEDNDSQSDDSTYDSIHSKDILSMKSSEAQNVDHVSELLKGVSGVSVTGGSTPQNKRVLIRGMGGNRVVQKVDGAKRFEQTQGSLSSDIGLEADSVRAIEVQRGGESVSHGSGAIGGAIHYKTISPQDLLQGKKQAYKLKSSYATASQSMSYALTAATKVTRNTDMLLQVVNRDINRSEDGGEDKDRQEVDFDRSSYMMKVHNRSRVGSLKAKLSHTESMSKNTSYRAGENDNTSNYEDSISEATIEHGYNSPSSSLINLRNNFYANKRVSVKDTHTPWRGFESTVGKVEDNLVTYGGKLSNYATIPLFENAYMRPELGVEFDRVNIEEKDGAEISYFGESTGDDYGVYIKNDISFLDDKVVLNLGARVSQYDRESNKLATKVKSTSGSTFSNVIGINIKALPFVSIFGKITNSNRAPETRELYYGGGTPFSCHWPRKVCNNVPNSNLNEEFSYGREVGVAFEKKGQQKFAHLKVSYFADAVSDYIDKMPFMYKEVDGTQVPAGPTDATHRDYRYQNLSKVIKQGIEAKFQTGYKSLEFGAKYSSMNIDCLGCPVLFDGSKVDEPLYTAPADKLSVNLDYHFRKSQLKVGYIGLFVDSQSRLSERYKKFNYSTPGYSTHGFFTSWAPTFQSMGKIRLDLAVDNVTNKLYKVHSSPSGANELGRNYKFSFSKFF